MSTTTFNFSDFQIEPQVTHFTGNKISLNNVLNVEVIIHKYKVEPSKKKTGTELLTLQIEKDKTMHVLFSGSTVLIDMIKRVDPNKFPFCTKIVMAGEFPKFT